MKYWCNCIPSIVASGKTPCKTICKRGYDTTFYPVKTVQVDVCEHCGHTAYFSKENPNREELTHV